MRKAIGVDRQPPFLRSVEMWKWQLKKFFADGKLLIFECLQRANESEKLIKNTCVLGFA